MDAAKDIDTVVRIAERLASAKMRFHGMYANQFRDLCGDEKVGWQQWWSGYISAAVVIIQLLRYANIPIILGDDLPDIDSLPWPKQSEQLQEIIKVKEMMGAWIDQERVEARLTDLLIWEAEHGSNP